MYKFVLHKLEVIYNIFIKDEESRNSVKIEDGGIDGSERDFASDSDSHDESCVNYEIDDDENVAYQKLKGFDLKEFLGGVVMKVSASERYQSSFVPYLNPSEIKTVDTVRKLSAVVELVRDLGIKPE